MYSTFYRTSAYFKRISESRTDRQIPDQRSDGNDNDRDDVMPMMRLSSTEVMPL